MAKKKIYTSFISYDDSKWLDCGEEKISKYIYKTVVNNIRLLKKYPSYIFSFSQANNYEMIEEYYPNLFDEIKEYVKQGKWSLAGSQYVDGDINILSPESIFRNILFGNDYFKHKFNKECSDFILQNNMGLNSIIPTILNHANIKGINLEKDKISIDNENAFGLFSWNGVDNKSVYCSCINECDKNVRQNDIIRKALDNNSSIGIDCVSVINKVDNKLFAPKEKTLDKLQGEIAINETSSTDVLYAGSDKVFVDASNKPSEEDENTQISLPILKGESYDSQVNAGEYTARTLSKKLNRQCEELADLAERNSVIAKYLGVGSYNQDVIDKAWKRFLVHSKHNDIAGLLPEKAYSNSWKDYALSINQFSNEIETSLSEISSLFTTNFCKGTPVMVSNTLEFERIQAVTIDLPKGEKEYVKVYDADGNEVKSQINSIANDKMNVTFIADVKAMGYRIYDIVPTDEPCTIESDVLVNDNRIENQRYSIAFNDNGDIVSIIDKMHKDIDLIDDNIELALYNHTGSKKSPVISFEYKDIDKKEDAVPELVNIKTIENGPARATVRVEQKYENSSFVNYVSLYDDSDIVEVYSEIDWHCQEKIAKQRFSFTLGSEFATYDLGLGAVERPNMNDTLYEVPAQKWVDITDESKNLGVSVISECKYGWDKFDDNTLRMTVLSTPKYSGKNGTCADRLDSGTNKYSYALYSHEGKVGIDTQNEARAFIQPMVCVALDKHNGKLGTEYSFFSSNSNNIIVRAMKKAQNTDVIIVRLNEGTGEKLESYELSLGNGINQAVELYASEEFKNEAKVKKGKLITSFEPFEVKTFAVVLNDNRLYNVEKPVSYQMDIEFNKNIITRKFNLNDDFEYSIPRNLISTLIETCGTKFDINLVENNALIPNGEKIKLKHLSNCVKILCASTCEDIDAQFLVDDKKIQKKIYSMFSDVIDIEENNTIQFKDCVLGAEFSHCRNKRGKDMLDKNMRFFVVSLDTSGASTITLPDNKNIVIIGINEIINHPNAKLITNLLK